MDLFIKDYYKRLTDLIKLIEITEKRGRSIDFLKGIEYATELIRKQTSKGKKLIFIGNGASAAISSHQATDFWKNGNMRAIAFNDAALLTCLSNDIGYEYVFEKSIEMFAEKGDILIAISSSGRSKNIIKGVAAGRSKGCCIITLTGFSKNNPLRKLGDMNLYVPSSLYGHVEILHHSICHCMLEYIMNKDRG